MTGQAQKSWSTPQLGLMLLLMLAACSPTESLGREASGKTLRYPSHASAERKPDALDPAAKAVLGYVGTVAKREVVCLDAADADFTAISALYASIGWNVQRPGKDRCPYLVHYNEAYNETYSFNPGGYRFNTEKCVFDIFTEAGGSRQIVRAAALRSRPDAIKNCAARFLLGLEGRSSALRLKDAELTRDTGASAEAVLSKAIALLKVNP
jgi:hypothetical protein